MLIPKNEFIGLDEVTHLCAGGECPMLRSHETAIAQFMQDKAAGERARELEANMLAATRQQCAELFSVAARDITFLSSASEGINVVMYGMQWQAGDNVVIADVEFSSGVFPWTRLQAQGVEIRIVRHKHWQIELDDIDAMIDARTRVVLMSHVSMFTGQRIDLPALSKMVRSQGARLVLDATHAAGVVPVEAALADVVMSSCYKWLLGVHGTAVFYWNRTTFPELETPFLGWNSVSNSGGWQDPTSLTLRDDADRFIPGNPSFISLYVLNNALKRLLPLGLDNIESHALAMTKRLHSALSAQGWEVMTPQAPARRAGNVCLMTDRVDEIAATLRRHNVMVWGTYAGDARLRISTHVYNEMADVERCIDAMGAVVN